jgi:signal transduction histidine kinase/DNA-binding response OmpR family regulator
MIRSNQAHLQAESLSIMMWFMGIIGYIWLWLNIWPVTGGRLPVTSWIGSILIVTGVFLCAFLKKRHLQLATFALLVGLFGAATYALMTFSSPSVPYLFIIPIVFVSVLLRPSLVFLSSLIASSAILTKGFSDLLLTTLSMPDVLCVATIFLITLAALLSSRNSFITLDWFSTAYDNARRSEQIARERQAEMRRLLKALDEATQNLERTNHRLIIERNEAESARRLKQQFAQTISHELRTPLNLILEYIDLMAQSPEYYGEPLPIPYMRDLSIVHRNAQHLQRLVNDVLDLARIEAAQMSIVPEEAVIEELVDEAVYTARSLVEAQGLNLYVQIEPNLPHLWIDPTRIRQVIFNLLNNAARFTEVGSVTVEVGRSEQEVVFSVCDTGIGISEEKIPRLFKEFEQLDNTMRRPYGGAGLGLAICQRFVELHRGRIWVTSEVGKGSTFYFTLPLQMKKRSTDLNDVKVEELQINGDNVLLALTRSNSAITLLERYKHSYQVIVAHDVAHAKSITQHITPKCVIVDTADRLMDMTALQSMVREWNLPSVPFIAYPIPGEELLSEQLSILAYITKPVSAYKLRETLELCEQSVERVLLVDDNRDFARLITRMLAERPYQISCAYSGKEAMELMYYKRPDLILLDWHLPDIDAKELIHRIRHMDGFEALPIVVISGQDELERPGSVAHPIMVTKGEPFTPGEILYFIKKVIDTANQQSSMTQKV